MSELIVRSPSNPQLIIVANRLPVTVKRSQDGNFEYLTSAGGLVSGLSGMSHRLSSQWYGWPGIDISEREKKDVKEQLWRDHHAVPVWLSENLADSHYNGFSNTVLWPLLHYHPGEFSFDKGHWKSYQEVNKIYAQLIVQDLRDGDIIWIHDYHLMLLPSLLRAEATMRGKHVKIGFFLHTPFPSSQIYRILPARKDILLGVLGSDLIAFHTYDYAKHFLRSCSKILDIPASLDGIKVPGPADHVTRVRAFPIGIDPERFLTHLGTENVRSRIHHLRENFRGRKILVGIDRLDYVKGIPQKLHAFENFLQCHSEWVGRAVFVQLAIPTRPDVEDYQCLRSSVNEQVGRINGRFGTVEYVPVHFIHGTLPFDELLALYAVSDVCVVTPTRDGMNLVALEYVASHSRHSMETGVLVLSEFAGAAQSLPGSIIINPWDPGQIEDAYETSLCMGSEERWTRFQHLQKYVSQYTSSRWCRSFLEELNVGFVDVEITAPTQTLVRSVLIVSAKSTGFSIVLD